MNNALPPERAVLKKARAEIEEILRKYDVAAHVVMHRPGWIERFWQIWPSYSILRGDFPAIRIRSKLADYSGDAEKQKLDQAHTAGMVSGLAMSMGQDAMQFIDLAAILDKTLGATHRDGPTIADYEPGQRSD